MPTDLWDRRGFLKRSALAARGLEAVFARRMQRTQKLGDLGSNEPLILDYLAKHYAPTENPGRRPPLKDIQWYMLKE
ncbi:MAG: hypothetical protein H7Z75_21035 [Ferruginibacter sp.]|nr:hypothetical protein [Cytophagales bacterium]